jgi:ribosomal protein S18 acetylase RimI-like enzyme
VPPSDSTGSPPRAPRVRLDEMTAPEVHEAVERAVHRHAREYARRDLWVEERALEASREEFAEFLASEAPGLARRMAHIVDPETGSRVGETWYLLQDRGGRTHFWVDWLWVDPEHRRKGYGRATLRRLAELAREAGARSVGLSVWLDNPGALALYEASGFVPVRQHMRMSLG